MRIAKVRSLRFKLSWTHGFTISAVVLCFGFARYQIISYSSQHNFNQALLRDANMFVQSLTIGPGGFVWSTTGLSLGDGHRVEELRPHFFVTDSRGRVVRPEQYGFLMQKMLTDSRMSPILAQRSGFLDTIGSDGATYRFVTLPVRAAGDAADQYAHIGRPLSTLQEVLDESRLLYLFMVPLILGVSICVGWFLAGRALRPFKEVALIAEQITSKNLHTQIVSQHKEHEVQGLVKSFNAMVGRLERSFRQMRQFNADAAHELRTPLAILQGENEIALRSRHLPEEIRAVLASNLEELDKLTRIVNDMLILAEAEAGNHVLHKEPVELKRIIHDLIEQVRLLAAEKRVHITFRPLAEARILADELWIRRALLNILDNAIKYSREGGHIEVEDAVQNSEVRIVIRDSGIGISEEDLPRIFDRLYRADPARGRTSGGAGLGLALVRWIVEAHEGRIQVQSVLEKGTAFVISLPLIQLREVAARDAARN